MKGFFSFITAGGEVLLTLVEMKAVPRLNFGQDQFLRKSLHCLVLQNTVYSTEDVKVSAICQYKVGLQEPSCMVE